MEILRSVGDHVAEDVQTYQVDRAESCRFWPPESWAGESVHVFDRKVHLLHEAHYVEDGKCSDAIANEVGCVLGIDDALAELDV